MSAEHKRAGAGAPGDARRGPPAPVGAPPPAAGDGQPHPSENKKSRKAAIYVRVSTNRQSTDNQEHVLREACASRGWELRTVYDDTGHSGSKTSRPALDEMLKDAARGKFDVVLIWKLDRLGRSVIDLHNNAEHLKACGVDLCAYTQAIDTSTPTGKLMFTVLAAVAEFERETIVERVHAGLETARRKGVRLGRPRVDAATEETVRRQLTAGVGMNKIVATTGVGKATVQRIKKELVS